MNTKKRAQDLEPGDFIVLQFNHFPADVMRVDYCWPADTVPAPECHQYVEPELTCMVWGHGLRESHLVTYTLMRKRERVRVLTYQEAADRAKIQSEENK